MKCNHSYTHLNTIRTQRRYYFPDIYLIIQRCDNCGKTLMSSSNAFSKLSQILVTVLVCAVVVCITYIKVS